MGTGKVEMRPPDAMEYLQQHTVTRSQSQHSGTCAPHLKTSYASSRRRLQTVLLSAQSEGIQAAAAGLHLA